LKSVIISNKETALNFKKSQTVINREHIDASLDSMLGAWIILLRHQRRCMDRSFSPAHVKMW